MYDEKTIERFNKKVRLGDDSECWMWLGAKRGEGYGAVKINNQIMYAHRVNYEIHHGEINDGLHVLHSCDTPLCVNPHHLFLGTVKDNAIDKVEKGRASFTRHRMTNEEKEIILKKHREGYSNKAIALELSLNYFTVCWFILRKKHRTPN